MDSLYDRISKGTISVDEITASMQRSTSVGGKYFQSMEKQSKTLNGQISTLKDNFSMFAGVLAEDTTNAITSEFLPAINDMIQAMQEAFSEDGFEGLANAFADGFTNILMMLVEKTPEVIEVAMSMIQAFINSIEENLPMITESLLQIITLLIQGIIEMLPQITEIGIQIIIALIQGISQQAPNLVPQIIDCIILIVETLIDNLDLIIEAGIELVLALIKGIFNSLPKLIVKLPGIILKIAKELVKTIFVEIPKVAFELVSTLISSILSYAGNIIKKMSGFFQETIFEPLAKVSLNMPEIGLNLIKGLWNGINDAKDWIMKKIKGFGKSVLNGFKDFFGISSPSKLMKEEVGKYIAEGVGVGFEDELSSVYDEMQKAINLETEKMSANVQTGNVYNKIMNTTPVQVNGTYTSRLEVNGEVLAEVVNDVNDKKDLQYMF